MRHGRPLGPTETLARTRTECSERPLPEPSSRDAQQRSLSRRGRTALAIAGVTLASLSIAVSVGCGAKTEAPASPSPSTKASVESSPAPQKSAAETIPTVENLEMDASLLNDPEALVETFVDERTTEWYNAGATPNNAQAAIDSDIETIDEFATRIAAKYDKVFIDALLTKDWESDPDTVKWVERITSIHRLTLAMYFYTSFPDVNPLDKEPYRQETSHTRIDSIANQTSKSITIVTTEKDYNNADMNRAGEDLTGGETISGSKVEVTSTYVVIDGRIKLSKLILGPNK
jgi:hypothetical protein